MESASDSPNANALEKLVDMSHRKSFRSATQMLWDKLEGEASLYLLCRKREGLKEADRHILAQCEAKLELARRCIDRRVKRPFSFWELIHEVDGLLLLVIPAEMLPSRGLEILESFKCKVRDPIQRRLRLGDDKDEMNGPLPMIVKQLLGEKVPVHRTTAEIRHTLRGALGVINTQTDLGFWQLSINVTIQLLSGLLIILLLAGSIPILMELERSRRVLYDCPVESGFESLPWLEALFFGMFGLIGATLSNMLSKESFKVATGATTRWFLYYLFVKPLIGGFAALFVFLVERSTLLLEIVVAPSKSSTDQAIVQINVGDDVQAFLVRAALALVAGVFADRVLSSTMERVLGKILMKSEKTLPSVPKPENAGEPAST